MKQLSMSWSGRAWVIAATLALTACLSDDAVNPPAAPVDPMFARYVALGNSVTAGIQSLGINDSTQQRAYPVLVGRQMGSFFIVPSLNMPGCPPPIVNIYLQSRIDTIPNDCAFRKTLTPSAPFISNVAVPGAAVFDVFSNALPDADPNPLTTLILGGRTQIEAARAASPTFVSVWVGNNDWLGAVLDPTNPGDPTLVTEPAVFAARYDALLDGLDAISSIQGGILIGAAQLLFSPYLTQGRAWKAFEIQFDAQTAPLNFFDVGVACLDNIPFTPTDTAWASVPFAVGAPKLAEAQAKLDSVLGGQLNPINLVPVTLACTDIEAVTAAEALNIIVSVAEYNAAIAAAAQARDWPFVDPNLTLAGIAQIPGAILPFPALPPSPASVTAPFGTFTSRDGLHPSSATHEYTANVLIDAINAHYGTSIPNLPQ